MTLDATHLEQWASLAMPAAEEFRNYETLDQMVDRASLIFLGSLAGPSVEKIFKDSETDDSFSFYETQIQVETALGGSRFAAGEKTIIVITLRRFPDDLIGVPALWILRHAQDNPLGKMDRPEEDDVYWIPSLGIWVDRGDGRPVAPLAEAERSPDGVTMNDWVFDPENQPVLPFGATEAAARAMTVDEFVEYIRARW